MKERSGDVDGGRTNCIELVIHIIKRKPCVVAWGGRTSVESTRD